MAYRKIEKRVFSERYKNLLSDAQFIGEMDGSFKVQLYNILSDFELPCIESPIRYNPTFTVQKVTSEYVFEDMSKLYNWSDIAGYITDELLFKREISFIFDIIELWAFHNDDAALPQEINSFFEDNDLSWRLLNGEIIKIDSKQFEQDLINKHLKTLKSTQAIEPLFQNAYTELLESCQFLSKSDYKNAMLFAEKSYESVLKVTTGEINGQASGLITKAINADWFDELPTIINKKGFADNVLSALPYIRNQAKVGHGEGGEKIVITAALARLSINLSCSLSSYILESYSNKHLANKQSIDSTQKTIEDLPF